MTENLSLTLDNGGRFLGNFCMNSLDFRIDIVNALPSKVLQDICIQQS